MSGADWLREAVRAAPGSEAAAVAWRFEGALHLTIVAKATFRLVNEKPMTRVDPRPILWADQHHGNSPVASVRWPSDVAPRVPKPQVIVAGSACSGGAPTSSLVVRLGVFAGSQIALHKELRVVSPEPFTKMPLLYEKAFGGVGCAENPIGVGADGEAERPSLVHPTDPGRPAGLGVIGASWPARRRRLGETPRRVLEAPIAEIPAGFDWAYFQAAPEDQLVFGLRGDEWIVMDGLCPTAARMRSCLPRARGEARVFGLRGVGDGADELATGLTLPLDADTLLVDSDAQTCTLVLRNHLVLPDEETLSRVTVIAGVHTFDAPVAWPDPPVRTAGLSAPGPKPLTRDTERTAYLASEKTSAFVPATAALASAAPTATLGVAVAPSADALPFLHGMGPSPLAASREPLRSRDVGTGTLAALPDAMERSAPFYPEVKVSLEPPPLPSAPAAGWSDHAEIVAAPAAPEKPAPEKPAPEKLAPEKAATPREPAPAASVDAAAESASPPAPPAQEAPVEAAPKPKPKPRPRPKPRAPRPQVPSAPPSVKVGLYGAFGR